MGMGKAPSQFTLVLPHLYARLGGTSAGLSVFVAEAPLGKGFPT